MNKGILVGLIFILFIVLGLIIATTLPESITCTELGCPCENTVGERPCNTCSVSKPFFISGLINIIKVCSAKEIILCENGSQIGERIDIDKNSCKYRWQFFNIVYQ